MRQGTPLQSAKKVLLGSRSASASLRALCASALSSSSDEQSSHPRSKWRHKLRSNPARRAFIQHISGAQRKELVLRDRAAKGDLLGPHSISPINLSDPRPRPLAIIRSLARRGPRGRLQNSPDNPLLRRRRPAHHHHRLRHRLRHHKTSRSRRLQTQPDRRPLRPPTKHHRPAAIPTQPIRSLRRPHRRAKRYARSRRSRESRNRRAPLRALGLRQSGRHASDP
jgi:hypothetical protein